MKTLHSIGEDGLYSYLGLLVSEQCVHRDYSFSGSTLNSIFDDRIEIVTIGGG